MKKSLTTEKLSSLKIQNIPRRYRETKTRHKLLCGIGHNINIQFNGVTGRLIKF